jgi:hypothetical protein
MDDGLYHRSCWPRLRVPQTERQKILENIKQPAKKRRAIFREMVGAIGDALPA